MLSDYCLPFSPLLVPKWSVSSHRFTELQMYSLHHKKRRSPIAELHALALIQKPTPLQREHSLKSAHHWSAREKRQDRFDYGVYQGHLKLHPTSNLCQVMILTISWEFSRDAGYRFIFLVFHEIALTASTEELLIALSLNNRMLWAGMDLKLIS